MVISSDVGVSWIIFCLFRDDPSESPPRYDLFLAMGADRNLGPQHTPRHSQLPESEVATFGRNASRPAEASAPNFEL